MAYEPIHYVSQRVQFETMCWCLPKFKVVEGTTMVLHRRWGSYLDWGY